MRCPKCAGEMKPVAVEGVEVDRCEACEGMWFDLREHEHLRAKTRVSRRIDTGDTAKGKANDEVRDILCPRCHADMVKMVFVDQPHIHYESCNTCGGVYLDAGEFRDMKHLTLAERVRHALRPLTA